MYIHTRGEVEGRRAKPCIATLAVRSSGWTELSGCMCHELSIYILINTGPVLWVVRSHIVVKRSYSIAIGSREYRPITYERRGGGRLRASRLRTR